jgi:hypothetical protein
MILLSLKKCKNKSLFFTQNIILNNKQHYNETQYFTLDIYPFTR